MSTGSASEGQQSHSPQSGDGVFLRRCLSALLRVMALGLFMGTHYLLNRALQYVVPKNLPGSTVWVEDCMYLVFLLIYLFLGWELLVVFKPSLKRFEYPGQGEPSISLFPGPKQTSTPVVTRREESPTTEIADEN
jgi:hypothetical protein